jgi:hypothetical protein
MLTVISFSFGSDTLIESIFFLSIIACSAALAAAVAHVPVVKPVRSFWRGLSVSLTMNSSVFG